MVYKKRHALSRLLSKQRIQEKTSNGNWTSRYIGSLIYKGVNGQESLEGIQTADGVIDCSSGVSNAQMQYFLRDHLGSVRVIASDKNTVVSRTDYLPFGVRMTGNGLTESTTARSAWFGFSGKENELWDVESSTSHWLRGERYQHFGARYYDPVVCVFMQIDPATEKYFSMSPYNYCVGNPIITIDPNGRKPRIYIQKYVHKYGHVLYWGLLSEGYNPNIIKIQKPEVFIQRLIDQLENNDEE